MCSFLKCRLPTFPLHVSLILAHSVGGTATLTILVYDCDSPSESSRRFRRELMRRVQDELLTTAGDISGPVEQQLLRQVADIIRRCERELLRPAEASLGDVPTSERRTSYGSTTSAGSVISSPHPMMPIGPPALGLGRRAMHILPSRPPQDTCNITTPPYGSAATPMPGSAPVQYMAEPAVEFMPIVWDEQTYSAFGDSLDWDTVFSVGPHGQGPGSETEPFSTISAPMYA